MHYRILWLALLLATRLAVAQPATRELILSNWEDDRWTLHPALRLEHNAGRAPNGEELSRIVLPTAGPGQKAPEGLAVLTQVNLPATATAVTLWLHQTAVGPGRHEVLLQDEQGWGATIGTQGAINADTKWTVPLGEAREGKGWSGRVEFFKSKIRPPLRLRGFRLAGRDAQASGDNPITLEAGPVKVAYTPDDAQWLYTDLQPKTIRSRDGATDPVKLRLANLGTQARTFRLNVRPVARNLKPVTAAPMLIEVPALQAGEVREIPLALPLALLGRYTLEYKAEGDGATAQQTETVAVVNALDQAEGFRHWAARRKWFSVPDRRPETDPLTKEARIAIGTANNGLSSVPIFPVLPRKPRKATPVTTSLAAADPAAKPASALHVLSTQLSPAWVVQSGGPELTLFGNTRSAGLGAPSHVALMTAAGPRILKAGETQNAAGLKAMTRPWLLVWWQGSEGWSVWDAPFLVTLQHRPTALKLDGDGLALSFANAADAVALLPLYGYAKLPQQAAFEKHPELFRLPAAWPVDDLKTWNWDTALPATVAARCDWWSRALTKIPVNVRETYHVEHTVGAVVVRDEFDYLTIRNDWNTEPITLAPFSPTLAVAKLGGYPMTMNGRLSDLRYPTVLGPYMALTGASVLEYSLDIGPFWTQTVEPAITRPLGPSNPARRAQMSLLDEALRTSTDVEDQQWEWRDDNFVLNAQNQSNRDPYFLTGFTLGPLRTDRKGWLQARTLHTLLDPTRYQMDERNGLLTRRYVEGPGIGHWDSPDWGDSGKLGTDMIWDAWVYAFNTGDYQTIADKWDIITSLNASPVTMSWAGVGRSAIAEMGDEAPPMLALARLAWAIGDRETYTAAVYWYARELAHHIVQEGAFTKWREEFGAWHAARPAQGAPDAPTETSTNLRGTNAGWQPGGFNPAQQGANQWHNFYVRLDDVDTLRFHQKYALELPRRVVAAAPPAARRESYPIYFARVALLNDDVAAAQADFSQNGGKPAPDNYITRLMAAAREYPPLPETLIAIGQNADFPDNGWAWEQMGFFNAGLVSQSQMPKGKPPTPQWFWWQAPTKQEGVDWGEKWTFGAITPNPAAAPAAPVEKWLNPVSTLYRFEWGTPANP